jgi:uncharacterized protein (AIM24 family)
MPGYEKLNGKVVNVPVAPGQEVLAKRGAMLAYTGHVTFSPVSGPRPGIGGMLGRALSGEAAPLMVAQGSGTVSYGFAGLAVHVVTLDGVQMLSAESDRLLAHDANLQSAVVFLGQQGGIRGAVRGAVTGQGLFTTQLSGVGQVALLAHGQILELPVGGRQVVVDPQAYVGHLGAITVEVSANIGWREAVGKGSGEAIQLKLSGTGTVFVQASEQKF